MMQSWTFSIITSLFSVTWFFRNHSNMLICCSKTFIISIENSCAASYFFESHDAFFIFQDFWFTQTSKELLFEIQIFCNILTVIMCPCWIKVFIYLKNIGYNVYCNKMIATKASGEYRWILGMAANVQSTMRGQREFSEITNIYSLQWSMLQ